MAVTIYHNPRCTKSRQTLALLEARGITPVVIDYLNTPPSEAELDGLLQLLRLEPRELMRKQEVEYKQEGLDNPALSRPALIRAMVAHPRLIERPIVVANGKAAIGRPPEKVIEIL